ncbi:uncharacterized protein LOC110466191 isoform X2 [Mizuhopecten yessoensis]|uniref:Myosin light chain kinase, smooth muscle n=1 Tax=Mizuhopecten yessoensis TaxID=6573 RepID=A0A210PPW9_MIZYE|nr:uncharacterized protein LOC110466191 isoform X2 [Mizuhopecten yessoensis]OWF38517.1 Myosin light chain kinase, smooth muscle [Mizuhopecten yessoensis]
MSDLEEDGSSRFDHIDLDSILSRVERRGPLTFTKRRCLYRAPEFVKRLCGEETVAEGSTVSFTCKVVAFPKPSLTLYKDGEQIVDHSRINIEPGEGGEYSLVIRKVTKKDEASYRCRAENDEGSSSSTLYLAVKAKSRSSKKSSSRSAAHKRSMFPPITEKVAEEEAEAEETKRSPESPLTHLYYGLTWKNREWPEFLGSWAFVNGMNSTDFDGISDSIDDNTDEDDVFMSDDSLNDAGTDFDTETDNSSQPESEGYYGNNRYNNDLPESLNGGITIPNLVFENKNLVRSKGHTNLSCFTSTRPLTFTKDENANKKILPNDRTYLCNDMLKSSPSDHCNDFKSEPEIDSPKGGYSCDKTTTVEVVSHPDEINWLAICLMSSSSTSLALFLDVAPHVFIFSLLIGQLLYILIRFLLNME